MIEEAQILTLDMNAPKRFINRELSWLTFNMRVLEEARNPAHPLLERLRFLSISGNNLDEFYMVRVAGLVGQVREGITEVSQDGMTPAEQLAQVQIAASELMTEQDRQWLALGPELVKHGITIVKPHELRAHEIEWLNQRFLDHVLPVVTPIAIDPAHPFPFVPNRGFIIVVQLRRKSDGTNMKALLPIPQQLDRFVRLPDGSKALDARFMLLEQMLLHFVPRLFPGYELLGKGIVRIIRDSDIEIEEEAELALQGHVRLYPSVAGVSHMLDPAFQISTA